MKIRTGRGGPLSRSPPHDLSVLGGVLLQVRPLSPPDQPQARGKRTMLVIRQAQMEAFRRAALLAFENQMVVHSKDFAPKLCRTIDDTQLREALRRAMDRAGGHGLTNRGPIRLFIELTFHFGSTFDTDPQYPWAAEVLHADDDQMRHANGSTPEPSSIWKRSSAPMPPTPERRWRSCWSWRDGRWRSQRATSSRTCCRK